MATIVYLDDDKVQHLLMKKLLKIHLPTCTAEFFSSPENLSLWLKENEAQMILSDVNFDGSSAWDWLEDFSSNSRASVVLLTAYASQEDRQKAKNFPALKAIWEKPLSNDNWQQISTWIG